MNMEPKHKVPTKADEAQGRLRRQALGWDSLGSRIILAPNAGGSEESPSQVPKRKKIGKGPKADSSGKKTSESDFF